MLWILLNLSLLVQANICNPEYSESLRRSLSAPVLPINGPATGAPVVAWLTELDHDFGERRQGHPAAFVFKFKNITSDTLLLQTVRTTCGCTAARYTEEPIAPGAAGDITIEYDAYQRGAFSKKIRVFFDKQKKPEILWIRGEVE